MPIGESEAGCPRVNLLRLLSRKALDVAELVQRVFPQVDFGREVTVGHLLFDHDVSTGALAKGNPLIRSRDDVEFLWKAVLDRRIHWVVSDHACCATEV
jgi:allantoinase